MEVWVTVFHLLHLLEVLQSTKTYLSHNWCMALCETNRLPKIFASFNEVPFKVKQLIKPCQLKWEYIMRVYLVGCAVRWWLNLILSCSPARSIEVAVLAGTDFHAQQLGIGGLALLPIVLNSTVCFSPDWAVGWLSDVWLSCHQVGKLRLAPKSSSVRLCCAVIRILHAVNQLSFFNCLGLELTWWGVVYNDVSWPAAMQ